MNRGRCLIFTAILVGGCVTEKPNDPLHDYEEVDATTILDAPSAVPGRFAPENLRVVERGEYLVELLGCGVCHTNGALVGEPDLDRLLAGSRTGIAYANPLENENPGVVYPPNITPDPETGIGNWIDREIANAVRAGIGRHVGQRIATMPWQGYSKISDDDVDAIVRYLRSIKPVRHRVPDRIEPGDLANNPFVYFGFYRSKP
jgi:mono/diheme cytochrome c family protein